MNATNDAGGINGHPIKIITMDDTGNPTTALTDVQKMVESDHIVALLEPASVTSGYMTYLNGKGIPAVTASGFYGISPGLTLNASTSLVSYDKTEATLAKLAGKTSYADVYCAEITICKSSDDTQKTEAATLGLKFVSFAEAASATSYTAACLQLKSQNIEAVALDGFTDTDIRFASDCVKQGYHPLWVTVGTALTPAFLTTPALSGIEVSLLDFPWFENDTPATVAFQAALTKYLPNIQSDTLNYSANLSAAYAAGTVFAKAATNATDPTNVAALLAGFAKITNDNFGGLTPPLTFGTPDLLTNPTKYVQPQANCFFAIQDTNGAWTKPNGMSSYAACVQ
jgi:branched-chain amino acid transport system substrate-binding protein